MSCGCGKPKCDGHCGISPAVLQINNPSECTLFHRVEVPASMGTSTENPPKNGAYRNVLLVYEADDEAFLYSSDGIPTKITRITNDYVLLENKPQVNGVTLEGDKSLSDLGITDAINAGVAEGVAAEAALREAADQDLQNQIDTIEAASDVVDVVGTYAELQSYDISKLGDNDIIKVLTDETHDDAISYYRFNKQAGTWTYVGSQGPFYTKSETDATFVPQTRTVNGKALSTDITLTAIDVNALPASTVVPTVNNATLTIKQGDTTLGTFSANASENVEINLPASNSIRLTVAYGEGTWENGDMPGLDLDPDNALAKGYISGRIIPSPTFTDESTGTVYTLEDVYNLLEDGKKITLDAVPLGWYIEDSSEPVVQLVDGVPITSRVDSGRGLITYFGGAMCSCAQNYATVTMFGIAIFRYIRSSNQSVAYDFVTQGAERITQVG